ncbi:MAG: VWA-like domain-containing protein [Candidatus Heimdallarchaeaceae archaeon]
MTAQVDNSGERIKQLIARFVLKYNYWGYLFARIRRRPAQFHSIMGVAPEKDGTISLYYNPALMEGTSDSEVIKVIEHEGMHLLNKHIPRFIRILANEVNEKRKADKHKIWNVAADCCVNEQIGLTEPVMINGKEWPPCLPENYGMPKKQVTEFYFYELLKNAQKIPSYGALGDHEGWLKAAEGVSDLSSLSRKVDQHLQNIIRESVKNFSKERGRLPGYIADLIAGALEPPKAPYYQIIARLIRGTKLSKFKRSPTRINRKRVYTFHLKDKNLPLISPFPGKMRDLTFMIVVLVDTSGSMNQEDILEGLSGVKNIIEKDRHCYVVVLEVDTVVEKEYEVNRIKDIQFDVKGRGGTTLRPGLERARELMCDVCLAFTDGFTENINEIPRKALPKKIIWVIDQNGTAETLNQTGPVVRITK